MTRVFRPFYASLVLGVAVHAQPAPDFETIIRSDPVVVEESRLGSDAAGTTRIRIDETTPAATQSLPAAFDRLANVHLDTSGAGSFGSLLSLRGLSNTPYFSDPAVTVYLDDLPLGGGFTYPTALFGFGTVTVFRGPHATTFGRAGEAGVVVFNSAAPGSAAAGELRASVGNYDAYAGAVSTRSARGPTADATVTAAYSSRHGYVTNTELGTRVDDQNTASAATRVRVRPTRTSEITLQLLGQRLRQGAQPLVPLGGPLFSVARGREGDTESDFGGAALKAAFDTDLGRLSATTSYTDWTLGRFTNRLVLPPPLDSSLTQAQRVWNEELRLASAPRATVPWSLGAWWSTARTTGSVTREIPNLFPIESSSYVARSRTFAVFGEALAMGESDWRLSAGLRAERVQKDFSRTQQVPGPGFFAAEKTFKSLAPRLTGSWLLGPETTASLSYSLGQRPGGWSAYTGEPALARFKAERTSALEAGVTTSFARRSVLLSARAFSYSIRDFQIERSFTATDYLVVNAPRARSLGGEVEASWRPAAGLTAAASLGVTRVTLREFTDPFTRVNYTGKRAPYVPAFDANLSLTYRMTAGWFAVGEWVAIGRTYYDETESAQAAQPRHSTANARLGYENRRWRVTFYGENLTDERYYAAMIPGVGHGVPGAPRTYGVEAAVKW